MHSTLASAPGKVLITGGYLVLEPRFTGLVLSVSARFYSRISSCTAVADAAQSPRPDWAPGFLESGAAKPGAIAIWAHSPQVSASPSRYAYTPADGHLQQIDGAPNKFVELTLRLSLITVISLTGTTSDQCLERHPSIFIELRADAEFYAQPSLGKTGKTGLGSSAALVASLVTALFAHFGVAHPSLVSANGGDAVPLPGFATDHIPSLLHHVAQAAHCAAQGKVGSGFDISAAFFGSQKYRRFDPSILAAVVEMLQSPSWDIAVLAHELILPYASDASADRRLNQSVERFYLPPGFDMLLGDVSGGSETPGMVRKVLRWRDDSSSNSELIWSALGDLNDSVAGLFTQLCALEKENPPQYSSTVDTFCRMPASEWAQCLAADIALASNPVARCLADLQRTFSAPDGSVRAHLRRMGTAAGVEIEPTEQTALCDAVSAIPGVLFAGVPGAGGHDAIFAISLRCADVPALGLAMRAINADADASQPRVSPLNVARSDQGVTCCVTRAR